MPFVGGPNTRITNPIWRQAAILEKWKNQHYLRESLTDRQEIWHDNAV